LTVTVEWGLQVTLLYLKELACKRAVLLAFGGTDVVSTCPCLISLDRLIMCASVAPSPANSDEVVPLSPSPWMCVLLEVADAVSALHAPSPPSAQRGRVDNVTQDTVSLYISTWSLEPFLDMEALTILTDLFACEVPN
jgi:hypothetical protein